MTVLGTEVLDMTFSYQVSLSVYISTAQAHLFPHPVRSRYLEDLSNTKFVILRFFFKSFGMKVLFLPITTIRQKIVD